MVQKRKHSPAPPGWNKTIADIVADSNRQMITPEEAAWARDYERSLLPANTRFPRKGDVFEAMEDVELNFLTHWLAPFTGGGKGILKRGERILVADDPFELHPILMHVRAENHPLIEERMVSSTDRSSDKYGGFTLQATTADLNSRFKLVKESGYQKFRYRIRRFLNLLR